jgi:hypothetical protein
MRGKAAAALGLEHSIGKDILLCHIPVRGYFFMCDVLIWECSYLGTSAASAPVGTNAPRLKVKGIHSATVPRGEKGIITMAYVGIVFRWYEFLFFESD